MKIITITSLFPNSKDKNRGIFVLNRVKAMSELSNLEVIAPIPYFPFIKKNRPCGIPSVEYIEGIKVYHPKFFSIPKFFKFLDGWFFYLCLKRFENKIKSADIIDSHFGWPDGYGSYLMAKKLNKKFSVTLRGSDVFCKTESFILKKKILKMLNNSDLIIGVSNSIENKVKSLNNKLNVEVISNGVDENKFYKIEKSIARTELNLSMKSKIFLTVGNNFKIKGVFELVKNFKKIKLENKLLIIVGNGEGFEELKKIIKYDSDIILTGKLENSKLNDYYNSCDVFCLVSFSEGCPNSLMEAFACGKPCLVTKEAGEEFVNEKSGIITKHGNLNKNMIEIMNIKFNTSYILSFVKNKSWKNTGQNVIKCFEKVIENEKNN